MHAFNDIHVRTKMHHTNKRQANRRLLQTPSLVPFPDGESPFSAISMQHRGRGNDEEGQQRDGEERAPRMSLPLNDGHGEWDHEEDATHPQHQQHPQQLSPRTRLRKWRAAVGVPQQHQHHHHIASRNLEEADERLAHAAARRGSTGGGIATGDGESGDVWDDRVIVQGAGEKESVLKFGEVA